METIKLDLIPGKKMPSLHASQYDDGRDYHIDLTENRVPYTLDGTETISLTVRKCDNTLVTMDVANTFADKSYIEFRTTEQCNACSGFNYGEITLEKNGTQISSLNFYLQVEGAPDEGGITSQSDINNLNRQITDEVDRILPDMVEDIAPEVISEVATPIINEAVPAKVEEVAPAIIEQAIGDNYYDKTAIDNKLTLKANANDVYNKSSVDDKLALKADSSYTSMLSSVGDDVVERIFNGFNSLKRINLIGSLVDGYINYQDGSMHAPTANQEKTSLMIPVTYGHSYIVKSTADKWKRVSEYNSSKTFIRSIDLATDFEETYTPNSSVAYVRVSFRSFGDLLDTSLCDTASGVVADTVNKIDIVEHPGYIDSVGVIQTQSTIYREVYSDLFALKPDVVFNLELKYSIRRASWLAYATYDNTKTFIERVVLHNEQTDSIEHLLDDLNTKITNGARYIAFSYRTYGEATLICRCNDKDYIRQKSISDNENEMKTINDAITDFVIGNSIVRSVNHRGYNTIAPENTIPAFKLSKTMGFDYVETDVQFTSDGVPILLHDTTINRTGRNADGTTIDTTIYLSSLTYAQTQAYDFGIWKSADYAGTKLPKFEDFVKLCKNIGLTPYIELKNDIAMTQAQVESLVDIVKSCGMIKGVVWISFSEVLLGYVKNYDNAAKLGFLVESVSSSNITKANALKTTDNEVFIDSKYSTVDNTAVGLCVAADIPLEVWTVNVDSTIIGLNAYITGVTSDNKIASRVLYTANM